MNRFCHYELRTTDMQAARAFYRDLLGDRVWHDGLSVHELPSPATPARPPHWLGHIGVADLAGATRRFVESGAAQLGPTRGVGGDTHAILRDPFGAIVALRPTSPGPGPHCVRWHLLNAADEVRAFGWYAGLCGWSPLPSLDTGSETGRHLTFTWDETTEVRGSVSNLARLPHVHPHWLFFFATEDLEESLARVRIHGGLTLPVVATAQGNLVAACEDPQGAAFGLHQAGVP